MQLGSVRSIHGKGGENSFRPRLDTSNIVWVAKCRLLHIYLTFTKYYELWDKIGRLLMLRPSTPARSILRVDILADDLDIKNKQSLAIRTKSLRTRLIETFLNRYN